MTSLDGRGLPEPTWRSQCGRAYLYRDDCANVLKAIPTGAVDAVVTDPPYDDKTHDGHLSGVVERQSLGFMPLNNFDGLIDSLVGIANRWVVMTCATSHCLAAMNRDDFIRMGIWVKPNGAPQFTGDRPGTGWEAVAMFHRKGQKRWNGGGHHAVWTHCTETGAHPTQKPVGLVLKWLEQFTDAKDVLLDPFMGSGTCGVAALRLGRCFIGVEISDAYFKIAKERIVAELAQTSLFGAK